MVITGPQHITLLETFESRKAPEIDLTTVRLSAAERELNVGRRPIVICLIPQ